MRNPFYNSHFDIYFNFTSLNFVAQILITRHFLGSTRKLHGTGWRRYLSWLHRRHSYRCGHIGCRFAHITSCYNCCGLPEKGTQQEEGQQTA